MNKEASIAYAAHIYEEIRHLDDGKPLTMEQALFMCVAVVVRMKTDGFLSERTLH